MKKIFFFIVFLTLSSSLWAQKGYFRDTTHFWTDVEIWLDKDTTQFGREFKDSFTNIWETQLVDSQRVTVRKVTSAMYRKGFKVNSQVRVFWLAILHGYTTQKLSGEKIAEFLDVTRRAGQHYDYNTIFFTYLKNSESFLRTGFLYKSSYNHVLPPQAEFSFVFDAPEIEEIPEEEFSETDSEGDWGETEETTEEDDEWGGEWGDESDTETEDDGWGDDWASDEAEPSWEDATDWNDHFESTGGKWDDSKSSGDSEWAEDFDIIDEYEKITPEEASELLGGEDGEFAPPEGEDMVEHPVMPEPEGPAIIFQTADLTLGSVYDTIKIKETAGKFDILKLTFVGKGGKADWKNARLSPNKVFCEFTEYAFNVRVPYLRAEYAKLTHTDKLNKPVVGRYEYQSVRANRWRNPYYPRFISYYNNNEVKDLLPNVKFTGGFSLIGRNISTRNLTQSDSKVEIFQEGEEKNPDVVILSSEPYVFTDSTFRNKTGKMTVYFNQRDTLETRLQDSITHKGCATFYYAKLKKFIAVKNLKEFGQTAFTNSYHHVEVTADHLEWFMESNRIELFISQAAAQVPAIVESLNYFDKKRFDRIKTSPRFHPLMIAAAYSRHISHPSFHGEDLATHFKLNSLLVRQSMYELHKQDYIDYDPTKDWVTIKPKGFLYAKANWFFSDYDAIQIYSGNKQGRNIVLDTDTKDLTINGVGFFPIRLRDPENYPETKYKITNKSITQMRKASIEEEIIDALKTLKNNQYSSEQKFKEAVIYLIGDENFLTDYKDIEKFSRADILDVYVRPTNGKIVMKKNRDFEYDGEMNANGLANFYGKSFKFNYDNFTMEMPTIDSIGFVVKDSITGEISEMPNKVKGSSGTFYIAHPKNKSNYLDKVQRKNKTQRNIAKTSEDYPYFDAGGAGGLAGTIEFGGGEILNGAYGDSTGKSPVTFELDSFSLGSLTAFDPKEDLGLRGVFHTDNIFPPIREEVIVMPDNSFGFIHTTEQDIEEYPEGLPLYYDSSYSMTRAPKFLGNIRLDNRGIRSRGDIYYMNAHLEANEFVFYLDSVTVKGKDASKKVINPDTNVKEVVTSNGEIKAGMFEGISFPDANMPEYKMIWKVKDDDMRLFTTDILFDMYHKEDEILKSDQKSTFKGSLSLKSIGLKGEGRIENDLSFANSPNFRFEQYRYEAKDAHFEIKGFSTSGKPLLRADHISLDYDMKKRKAFAQSEQPGEETLEFPYVAYASSLEQAEWDFDKQVVDLKSVSDKSSFISKHPQQDSLAFNARGALYKIDEQILDINGADSIFVVDSYVYPDSGIVTIRENANMDSLKNCRLKLAVLYDSLPDHKRHRLDSGLIKIHSRMKFKGDARYLYKNSSGKVQDPLYFSNFTVGMTRHAYVKKPELSPDLAQWRFTHAEAKVIDTTYIMREEGEWVKGKALLWADSADLMFRGYMALLENPNARPDPKKVDWIEIDTLRKEIVIEENAKDEDGNVLGTGLYLVRDSRKCYTATVSPLVTKNDECIFKATGVRELRDGWVIVEAAHRNSSDGSKNETHYSGNHFSYNRSLGQAKTEGKFDFFEDKSDFPLIITGEGNIKFSESQFTESAKLACMINLNLPNIKRSDLKKMTDRMELYTGDFKKAFRYQKNHDTTLYRVANQLESKEWKRFYDRWQSGKIELEEYFNQSILISDVRLKWSHKYKAFYGKGTVGLHNILSEKFNLLFNNNSTVEILLDDKNNPELNIYLELDEGEWYLISYKNKKVSMRSDDEDFNQELENSKSKIKVLEPDEEVIITNRLRRY